MTDNISEQPVEAGGVKAPLHRRIAENLTSQITSGELSPGQKLPSERKIAAKFGASRATVRTALQHLEQAGLITRRDRRSAVVAIQRDITPSMRIACGSTRLLNLFRKMADMHLLPPRCQLQLIDLKSPGILGHLMSQPASGTDVVICDLEYVKSLSMQKDLFCGAPRSIATETGLNRSLIKGLELEGNLMAIPLGISASVLYYNKAMFNEKGIAAPSEQWQWSNLAETAKNFTNHGIYGFQFSPTFANLSSMMNRQGAELYQNDGKVAASSSENFCTVFHSMNDMLHGSLVSPLVVCEEATDLFAQNRCAMTIGGAEKYFQYKEELGDNLGVAVLPGSAKPAITSGFAAVCTAGLESYQPVEDLLRALLNIKTQQLASQMGAGLPARDELLSVEALQEIGYSTETANLFMNQLGDYDMVSTPCCLDHKMDVWKIFLELWLGLDSVDNLCARLKAL